MTNWKDKTEGKKVKKEGKTLFQTLVMNNKIYINYCQEHRNT
jgi:hypothetical protein